MTLDVTKALERRRMRRRVTFWRALAIVLGIVAVVVIGARGTGGFGQKHIARVSISGIITNNRPQLELLAELAKDDKVAAVMLAVDSPGGTTTGGEALFEAIRELSAKKPVVAVCGTMATSAAYIVGLASDRIIARGNTVTGSIGVIFQWAEVTGLLDKLGIRVNEVKSGRLKAEPSMFGPLSDEGRALAEEMVAESQEWFNDLVQQRRNIDPQAVPGLTAGRIYSGRQALNHRLIDEIGGEREAIAWLESERGIPARLEVRDRKPKDATDFGFFSSLAGHIARELRLEGGAAATLLGLGEQARIVRLDGMVSVWHARPNSSYLSIRSR